jgi:hypothetical protein
MVGSVGRSCPELRSSGPNGSHGVAAIWLIFLLSLVAIFNPTLLAAVTIMMLIPNPKRLMLGYLLGAYTTSITCGCVIVFALGGSSSETSSAKHTISPAEDIIVGLLSLSLAWALRTGRDQPFQTRRQAKKEAKLAAKREAGKPTESLPLRMLGKGDPKITFLVGAVLRLPRRVIPRSEIRILQAAEQ